MRALLKFSSIFCLIFAFLGVSALLRLFFRHHILLQKKRVEVESFFCRLGLKVLQVKVESTSISFVKNEARLMVGNHMSYLDILILSSLYPTSYVTSQEIRETPFLGMLCEWAGCLFVERRNKKNLSQEISEIREALQDGLNVTIFPEATSTNGEGVLRFRTPLYQAAFDSKVGVQAFCLNYRSINNEAFSKTNRDLVCWYGDMDFASHLWKVCQQTSIEVSVEFLELLKPHNFSSNKDLASHTQAQVTEKFLPAL